MDQNLLSLLVEQARRNSIHREYLDMDPRPGDLVVEVSKFSIDPDAIGWLIAHGDAAYKEDGTGPTREIWDIVPLSGARGRKTIYQRWENARFVKVQTRFTLRPLPEVLDLISTADASSSSSQPAAPLSPSPASARPA